MLVTLCFAVLLVGRAAAGRPEVGPIAPPAHVRTRSATSPIYPPPFSPVVTAQSIIGTDDRQRVTDTTNAPWRAIAWVGLYGRDGNLEGNCTATFIGPDTLVTAAHCLWTAEDGFVSDMVVVPGKDGANEPFGHEFAANWWVPQEYIDARGNSDHDWAIVEMESKALGQKTGWFRVASLATATLARDGFEPAVFGYPTDQPPGTLWGAFADHFMSVGDEVLTYDIDTSAGESGAPVFSLNRGQVQVGDLIGIHRFGNPDAGPNGGARVDNRLLADIVEACQLMGCTIEAYSEPDSP